MVNSTDPSDNPWGSQDAQNSALAPIPPAPHSKKHRPVVVQGITSRVRTGHGNTYVTINFDEQGNPFEVLIILGKAGSCDAANMEAIGRLISLALRNGIPAEEIIDQLQGITCHPVWDQGELVRSSPDAVALALKHHTKERPKEPTQTADTEFQLPLVPQPNQPSQVSSITNPTIAVGFSCPKCSGPISFQEGVVKCQKCEWNQGGG